MPSTLTWPRQLLLLFSGKNSGIPVVLGGFFTMSSCGEQFGSLHLAAGSPGLGPLTPGIYPLPKHGPGLGKAAF